MRRVRILLVALAVVTIAEAASAAGRYCRNPHCSMCNRLFGPMEGYELVGGRAVQEENLPFDPTPREVVRAALDLAKPAPGELIYDLGCGDARVLVEGARRGCPGLGIEIEPETAERARRAVRRAGYQRWVTIQEADATTRDLSKADVIYLYLNPPVIAKLHKSLAEARVVVSYMHDVPQLDGTEKHEVEIGGKRHTFYLWFSPFQQRFLE